MGTPSYDCIAKVEVAIGATTTLIVCDDNGPFLATIKNTNGVITVIYTELDGTPYVPVGTVDVCGEAGGVIPIVLCDDDVPFLRQYDYDSLGVVSAVVDTELDGTTAYVTVGTVQSCPQAAAFLSIPVPNGVVANLLITASDALVHAFGAFDADTEFVFWTAEGGTMRYTTDGSDPIAGITPATSNGHLIIAGDRRTWAVETAVAAKFIRNTGIAGYVVASQFKGKVP